MKQLLMRFGLLAPPAPYGLAFERRESPSYYRMAAADMVGVGNAG